MAEEDLEAEPEREGPPADRLLPLFEHTHDTLTTAIVVAFAAAVGLVAGWATADFGVRFPAFVVGAVGTGYLLYGQGTRRAVVAAGLYSVAALLAVAPLLYELFVVVSVSDPAAHVLSLADLILLLLGWIPAGLVALVAYRVATGPFVPRIRARLG